MQITELVTLLVVLVGVLSPLLLQLFKKMKAQTKNEHVQLALTWASQVVQSIGQANHYLPINEKEVAVDKLATRMQENGMSKSFTYEQLEQFINQAAHFIDTEEDK